MDLDSLYDLKSLEEQIFQYKPNIKSLGRKKYVSDRLRSQLVQSKAVVKVQRLDAECESLMISLKKRLMLLQDFIIPMQNKSQEILKNKNEFNLNLSSESSDDEPVSSFMCKEKNEETQDLNISGKIQNPDIPEDTESSLPLALRRKPRERRLSCKSCTSPSTSRSKTHRTKLQKQKHSVTNLVEEHIVEQDELGAPTLHIKIPSLYRGNVHCIILDSLNFGRKIFDYRANEAKQRLQQQKSVSHKKQLVCASPPDMQQLSQTDQEFELSQIIQNVMAEACNDETLLATSALESINNNMAGNYDLVENDTLISYSQSSREFSYSQNSKKNVDTVCSTSDGAKVRKKRKNTKRSTQDQQHEPPKKRGRKKGSKNGCNKNQLQPQLPTKSNLAQYVELFSNDCELLPPGSTTPAASSTRSLPLVSSTTHSFDVVDQLPQQEQQNLSQHPITYYIDGDWANGGPCQLVTTNQDDNIQNFVNYIDNSGTSSNNMITTVLECNSSLPVSIPLSIANAPIQNKNQQPNQQLFTQSTAQNSCLPIINIHIPPLPNNMISSDPQPAHVHKEVIDLSIKSDFSANSRSSEAFNLVEKSMIKLDTFQTNKDDESLPLDLSVKRGYEKENNTVTIDSQDEDFIRRLIEESDFDSRSEDFVKRNEHEKALYDHENNRSFKSALDMPLLDFNATDLAELVVNTCNKEQTSLKDKNQYNVSRKNEESDIASMTADNSSLENNLSFCDQSTTEIFSKLLDICPDNHFLNDMNNEIIGNNLSEKAVFDQNDAEILPMCPLENVTNRKNQLNEAEKGSCENYQEIEIMSTSEPSTSTSLAVQLDSSNTTNDTSLYLKFSDSDSSDLNNTKLTGEINPNRSPSSFKKNNEVANSDENSTGKSKIVTECNGIDNNDVAVHKTDAFEPTISKLLLGGTKNKQILNPKLIAESNTTKLNNNDNSNSKEIQLFKENDVKPSAACAHLQPKENIVFSVAKITLSEDDNIYSSDSDLSSGKPCYLREVQNSACNYNNIKNKTPLSIHLTTDNSKTDEDINSFNSEEKKLANNDQELSDVPKNIDCTKVKNKDDETTIAILNSTVSNISNEKLSLLELETNLECPLDFDEDFDDVLSLATSCFDSPNDDRFEVSIVDINSTTAINTLQDLQQPENCPNSPQSKHLKFNKIPKVGNSTESINVSNISEGVKFNNSSINVEKWTRTITVDANVTSKENVLEKGKTIAENVMRKIFGVTCFPFLVDQCDGIIHCQLSHQLYDTELVYKNLYSLDETHANCAYKVMYNHSKLFKLYFNIFCTYYTKKNDRIKLFNMVNDCERYPECAGFLISIYEGLVECGLSRINACRLLLKCIRENNIATPIVEALVAIIMKSDWTMFTDFIKKFTEDIYQFKFSICILEQMAPAVLNSKGSLLKQVFLKCFQTLHCADTALLRNSSIILQCMPVLTTNT